MATVSPHPRPSFLPTGGHHFSPLGILRRPRDIAVVPIRPSMGGGALSDSPRCTCRRGAGGGRIVGVHWTIPRFRLRPRCVAAAYDVTYGQLGGVGPAVAVDVVCSNNGGTADGQIRFADVVFRGSATRVRLVGLITPRQPHSSNVSHVPLLGKVKWVDGRIVVAEYWYGPNDPTCCASGRATTTWAYRTGKLTAVRTVVTKRPTG